MPNPTRERAQEIADELIGSATNLHDVLTQEDESNTELLKTLDELAAQCESCGWWDEADNMNENGDCQDCA